MRLYFWQCSCLLSENPTDGLEEMTVHFSSRTTPLRRRAEESQTKCVSVGAVLMRLLIRKFRAKIEIFVGFTSNIALGSLETGRQTDRQGSGSKDNNVMSHCIALNQDSIRFPI